MLPAVRDHRRPHGIYSRCPGATFRLHKEAGPGGFTAETGNDGEPAGTLAVFDRRLIEALHVVERLVRSPEALSNVLEAAGPLSLERAGALLDEADSGPALSGSPVSRNEPLAGGGGSFAGRGGRTNCPGGPLAGGGGLSAEAGEPTFYPGEPSAGGGERTNYPGEPLAGGGDSTAKAGGRTICSGEPLAEVGERTNHPGGPLAGVGDSTAEVIC